MAVGDIFADFVAGWTSGVAGLLISHPMDTIKVRLQSLDSYRGLVQCVSQTVREESLRGFYKGMGVPLVMAGFLHSTFFVGYSAALAAIEETRRGHGGEEERTRDEQRKENPLGVLLAASVIGASLQWIPSCPVEIVKTKLQVQRATLLHQRQNPTSSTRTLIFTGPIDCIRQTVRHVGVRGFYRGGLTMLLRDAIGFCFYLPVYEISHRRLSASFTTETGRQLWSPMLAGGLAGVACWWSILPLDVIKSRLQADDTLRPKYRGLVDCIRVTYRTDGWSAFVRGWHVSALRGFPACACLFLVYEQTIRALNVIRQ